MALQLNCTEQQMKILERDFLVSSQENNNYGMDVDKKTKKNGRKAMKGISKKINNPPRKKTGLLNLSNEIGQERSRCVKMWEPSTKQILRMDTRKGFPSAIRKETESTPSCN